jgi:hypothetical protein
MADMDNRKERKSNGLQVGRWEVFSWDQMTFDGEK